MYYIGKACLCLQTYSSKHWKPSSIDCREFLVHYLQSSDIVFGAVHIQLHKTMLAHSKIATDRYCFYNKRRLGYIKVSVMAKNIQQCLKFWMAVMNFKHFVYWFMYVLGLYSQGRRERGVCGGGGGGGCCTPNNFRKSAQSANCFVTVRQIANRHLANWERRR
jgi:hypothetical protein